MVERITVSGFRLPRSARRRWRWPRWTAPIQLRDLLWIPLVAAVPVALASWGTPHLLLTYTSFGPADHRTYQSCFYVGLDSRMVFPRDGQCPWIRFLKATNWS